MKWSRSNKMKESFNCITHPHSTSCSKLSSSFVCRNGHCDKKMANNVPADDGLLNGLYGAFYQFSVPCSHSCKNSHPQTHIAHKHTQEVFHTQMFHTSNKPGYQKTINGPLSSAILQNSLHSGESSDVSCTLKDKAEHRYWLMPSSIYGTKKQGRFWNATSWLLEELIYSI